MSADLDVLEQLVMRAARQIHELRAERDRLAGRVAALEDERAATERQQATLPGPEVWQAERERVAAALREALDELRGD